MQVYLETERLVLRRFTEADVDNLFELDSNQDVMRFLTGGKPHTPRYDPERDPAPHPPLLRAFRRVWVLGRHRDVHWAISGVVRV
jgi:RimJ/RimL family protein N-acetyltransferase